MSVITRLRKARPYLTAPWNPDEDQGEVLARGLPPDRMSGVASTQPDQPIESIARRPMPSQTSDVPAVPNLGPEDYSGKSITPRIGRPQMDASIQDPQARLSDYEQNLINYQPQKEGTGKIIGRAALGFLRGGIPGAIATAGSDLLDRKALDRNWQRGEIQNTEGMIGRLNAEKRADLQDELIRSQTEKNRAEKTPPISQSRHKIEVAGDEFKQFGINKGDKVWADVSGQPLMPNGQPVLADRATSATRQPIFRERKNKDGTTSTLKSTDEGQTWTDIKDLTSAAPPQPEQPDVAAQNAPDIKTVNDRLQTNLKELRQHEDEIATKNAAIKKQAEGEYQRALGEYNDAITKGEKPAKPKRADFYEAAKNNDSDYLDGTVEKVNNRIKELKESNKKDQSDLEGLQRESRRATQKPRKVSSNVFKPASDGKYHYTEAQIRANLNGKTYEETVAHLKSLPNVVVEGALPNPSLAPPRSGGERQLPQNGAMPGTLHLNAKIAPKVPKGTPRPLAPGEWVDNPDGSWSSEISSTVQNPDKSWSVVPGMWIVNGKPQRVDEDTAVRFAERSGLNFPKYKTLDDAERFATDRESVWQGVKPQEASKIAPLWQVKRQ